MRILIDILHPTHVHLFKHFAREMESRGHPVRFTARDKDRSVELLREEGFDPTVLSTHRQGAFRLGLELLVRSWRFYRVARSFEPTVLTGAMGPTIAPVGLLARWPRVVLYDTEIAKYTNRWVYPMSTYVLTPHAYWDDIGPNQVRYPGCEAFAYLHPNRFTPDLARVAAAGVPTDRPFAFFRFVAFESSHDLAEKGLTASQRIEIVKETARRMNVVVSSEGSLPDEIARYAYQGPITDIHHVLAAARLTVGESATMTSESAILGTPSVYLATSDRGFIRDQARYGLVHIFGPNEYPAFRDRVSELLDRPMLAEESLAARDRLIADNTDVTSFLVDFFEEHFAT